MTMTDIDTEVASIAARKTAVVFKSAPDKAKVKATLTPVGTERPPALPNDLPGQLMSTEALRASSADLKRHAANLLAIARAIDVMIGDPEANVEHVSLRQATEGALLEREVARRAADHERAEAGDKRAQDRVDAETPMPVVREAFDERFARISHEAQARVFGEAAPDVNLVAEAQRIFGADLIIEEGWTDWVCPKHGDANVKNLKSKAGRKYRACEHCNEYEK